MFYTQPSKSVCILPSQQVLIWAGLVSDAQLEWLEASVVGGTALDHGCGSTDYGVALVLPNFVSVQSSPRGLLWEAACASSLRSQ